MKFAETLERVCVDTVEGGQMTKDLALLIGHDRTWLTTSPLDDLNVCGHPLPRHSAVASGPPHGL